MSEPLGNANELLPKEEVSSHAFQDSPCTAEPSETFEKIAVPNAAERSREVEREDKAMLVKSA